MTNSESTTEGDLGTSLRYARLTIPLLSATILVLLLVSLCIARVEAAGKSVSEDQYIYLNLAETDRFWSTPPKSVDEQIQRREGAQAIYSQYDGRQVAVEGQYSWGFEASRIGDIWVDFPEKPNRKLSKVASQLEKRKKTIASGPFGVWTARVRLFGTLECKKGGMYGHMGGAHAALLVDRMEVLE